MLRPDRRGDELPRRGPICAGQTKIGGASIAVPNEDAELVAPIDNELNQGATARVLLAWRTLAWFGPAARATAGRFV